MKIIGFRCKKDAFSWAVVDGDTRSAAVVAERNVASAPLDTREAQLAWVSKEVRALLERFHPTRAAIQAAGGAQGGLSDSLAQRIELDGVVRCVLGIHAIPTESIKPQSMPKMFQTTKIDFDTSLQAIPCVAATPKTHRDPVVLALSQLPA